MALGPNDPKYPLTTYFKVEAKYTKQIDAVMRTAVAQIRRELSGLGASPAAEISRARLEAQMGAVKAYSSASYAAIGDIVAAGQANAVKAAYGVMHEYEKPLLAAFAGDKAALNFFFEAEANRAAAGTRAMMDRMGGSIRPLSESVYRSSAWVNGQLDKRVNVALVRGLSQRDLAKSVIDLVDPLTPGGSRYAAMRLGRTEINNAFHTGSVRSFEQSGLVEKVDWNLSGSHNNDDECDSITAQGPYPVTEVPDKPHPQCFCWLTPVLPTADDFRKNLANGDYAEADWSDLVNFESFG